MSQREQIIITLTSWSARINNIPVVLESIYNQTVRPDKVVLNLSIGEVLSSDFEHYIDEHQIEVNYVPDIKVYKKLIPTLCKYPNACVINIDDDCVYPNGMIEEFITLHKKYPNFPISGNRVIFYGLQCHCGCASLTKYDYFGDRLKSIDDEMINSCPSDDMVLTYIATLNGHPYIHTYNLYFENLVSESLETQPYSKMVVTPQNGIERTYEYLVHRLGPLPICMGAYTNDNYLSEHINNLISNKMKYEEIVCRQTAEAKIRSTYAYRLGKFILSPLKWIKNIL